MRTIMGTLTATLAAALLVGEARAQVGTSASDVIREQQRRQQQQPPAQQPAPAPAPPAGAPGATPQAQSNTLQQLHHRFVTMAEWGRILAEKGTSPRIKEMGQRLQQEHQRLDQELTQLAQQRAVPLADASQVKNSPAVKQDFDQVRATPSGPELDNKIVEGFAADRVLAVNELKAARDSTPGKDAQLKKWLDDAENTMEEQRNLARAVRSEVQRQGRKP